MNPNYWNSLCRFDTYQFAINTSKMVQKSDRPTWKHYGKTSHEEANCSKVIWYPVGWLTRGNARRCGHGKSQGGHGGGGGPHRGRGAIAAYATQAVVDEPR